MVLNRRRVMMKIEDFKLPDEYEYAQHLRTIENEAAYIDTLLGGPGSNINPRKLELEIKFESWGGLNNQSCAIIGCRTTNSSSDQMFFGPSGATPSNFHTRWPSSATWGSYARNKQWVMEIKNASSTGSSKTLFMNDATIRTFNSVPNSFCGHMFLLAMNEANKSVSNYNGIKILYYAKFWYEGQIISDMIPVKRKADNKLGLYDKIRNIFLVSPNGIDFVI